MRTCLVKPRRQQIAMPQTIRRLNWMEHLHLPVESKSFSLTHLIQYLNTEKHIFHCCGDFALHTDHHSLQCGQHCGICPLFSFVLIMFEFFVFYMVWYGLCQLCSSYINPKHSTVAAPRKRPWTLPVCLSVMSPFHSVSSRWWSVSLIFIIVLWVIVRK